MLDFLKSYHLQRTLLPLLSNPIRQGPIWPDPLAVTAALDAVDIHPEPLTIDQDLFQEYMARAKYRRFRNYYGRRPPLEKILEHFLARLLLELKSQEFYLDVASKDSPTRQIYAELDGVEGYGLDQCYPPGLHGRLIGAGVDNIPLPDGSVDKMTLHCSFEHFEGDADRLFIGEVDRLLRPGGRCCILPLYLHTEYAVQTDLASQPWSGMAFEREATIHLCPHWGQRHGRYYDAYQFQRRVLANLGSLRFDLFRVVNGKDISPDCYIDFAALFSKPPSN